MGQNPGLGRPLHPSNITQPCFLFLKSEICCLFPVSKSNQASSAVCNMYLISLCHLRELLLPEQNKKKSLC